MKKVLLTKGEIALVDDDMYEYLNQWKWCVLKTKTNNFYAVRNIYIGNNYRGKLIYMHRLIMNTPKDMGTDHINHNSLDNRRKNLRWAHTKQNMRNQIKTHGSSKFKGACWDKQCKKWASSIQIKGKQCYHKNFNSEIDAAIYYDSLARKYYGEFACFNFPRKGERSCFVK